MRRRRNQEGGFALLFVFVMAAAIAITLFMELPRVAFEVQRGKEQMLVDRGEQYKRAIQIFYRKTKRYPVNMDELEKFQDVRFLRHRYKDPFTGKEEWRLIHVGAGGVLTDSLIKPVNPLGGKDAKGQNADGSQNPGFQQTTTTAANGTPDPNEAAAGGLNLATARRPSDKMAGGQPLNPVDPNNPNAPLLAPQFPGQYPPQQGQAQYPQQPGQVQQYPGQGQPYPMPVQQPPYPGQPPPNPGQPQQQFPGQQQQIPGQPQLPGAIPGQVQQFSGQGTPGVATQYPGQQPPVNPGFSPQTGQPPQNPYPNPNPYPQPQGQPQSGAQPNPAIKAITDALYSPRTPPPGVGSSFGNNAIAGGLAGVATTFKGPSIKVVNERQKYQEWEFVYDLKKDKSLMGPGAQNGMTGNGMGGPGMSGSGSTGAGFGAFGSSGGTGGGVGSGFGGSGSGGFGGGNSGQPTQPTQPNRPN